MIARHAPTDKLIEKWADVIDHPEYGKIKDAKRRADMALVLENTQEYLQTEAQMLSESAPTNNISGGNIATFDPILISLMRRSVPNLIAYDLCGVQPMTGPTGKIFAFRPRYTNQTGTQAFYNEANTGASTWAAANATANSTNVVNGANTTQPGGNQTGTLPGISNNAANSTYNYDAAMTTGLGEGLGSNTTAIFPEMSFSIDSTTVTAGERGLKAEYSLELAQDLRALHGLDAETELSNILATEILADINREVVRTIVVTAVPGSQVDTTTAGQYDLDVDANGRWMVEKFKGLHFQMQREANKIAKDTRRGKGNILLMSADVASALQAAGILQYTPALDGNNLQVDDTGNTFVGVLDGQFRCYIDPYVSGGDYFVMGYRGSNSYDAGLFYCPYVPLQKVRAVDPNTFQPKIGFKTRYGMVANPFAQGTTLGAGALTQDSNLYYRRTIVVHVG